MRAMFLITAIAFGALACSDGGSDPAIAKGGHGGEMAIEVIPDLSLSDSSSWPATRATIKSLVSGMRPGDMLAIRPIRAESYAPPVLEIRIPVSAPQSNNPFDPAEIVRRRSDSASQDSTIRRGLAAVDSLGRYQRSNSSDVVGAVAAAAENLGLFENEAATKAIILISDMRDDVTRSPAGILRFPPRIHVWIGGLGGAYATVRDTQKAWMSTFQSWHAASVSFLPPGHVPSRAALARAVMSVRAIDTVANRLSAGIVR